MKQMKKLLSMMLCFSMLVSLMLSTATAGVIRDEDNNISYVPMEEGVNSNGGYIIDKISHPTLGAGEIDGILTGEDQDRGNSYSWSMVDGGDDSDYIYIGTCYNSTYFIFHNNVMTSLNAMKKEGQLGKDVDTNKVADNIVSVMFGVDTFDKTNMNDWDPVIIAVSKTTGESKVVFRESAIRAANKDIFPGYPPYLENVNYLSGYRMAFEFNDKLYFAGMGNPTATLVEVDPKTNEARIAYYSINRTQGVSNGVHGLLVYDGEILMCLANDNYDGKGHTGGLIVASDDPTKGFDNWRVIGDQDDFDNLPAVMQVDGLNGGGIWDIIEYNGKLYVTIVTDKNIDGKINKQGFAMYRGDKQADGSFKWTQIIGDHGTSGYGFGLGIDHSMSCNMWVYKDHLYLGTYNDPMLDLAEIPATGNFELLYNDLDHSIYLYRMNENEEFELVGGKDDNPNFGKPIGNLGAGLGNNSNQYVWRMGVHNDEFYIGTYDTSTLTYNFTQITDGTVGNMKYEDISGRADSLKAALKGVLGEYNSPVLDWILDKTIFSKFTQQIYQKLAYFASEMSADKNPVPEYRQMLSDYEKFKKDVYDVLNSILNMSARDFLREYQKATKASTYASPEAAPYGYIDGLKKALKDMVDEIFEVYDKIVYDELIHNFVYYFGCNYYAQKSERGFDLLVSNDGVNFDAITRNGFEDGANHGLRCIASTNKGVYLGTANPYYGTQLWLMHSDADQEEPAEEYTVNFYIANAEGGSYIVDGNEVKYHSVTAELTENNGYYAAFPELKVAEGFKLTGWKLDGKETQTWDAAAFEVGGVELLANNGCLAITPIIVEDAGQEEPDEEYTVNFYIANEKGGSYIVDGKEVKNHSVTAELTENNGYYAAFPELKVAEGFKLTGWQLDGKETQTWDAAAFEVGGVELLANNGYLAITPVIVEDADQEEPDEKITITFKVVNGTWADNTAEDKVVEINKGSTMGTAQIPNGMKPDNGYENGKWDNENAMTGVQNENATYTYTFEKKTVEDDSPVVTEEHILKYVTNGGNDISSEKKSNVWTKKYEDLPTPERKGYKFVGWFYNSSLTKAVEGDVKVNGVVTLYANWARSVADPQDTGVADWLNTKDHIEYLHGCGDGTFAADKNMSRAEVAQMFYNLLLNKEVPTAVKYKDVKDSDWFAPAVYALSEMGIFTGYEDGTFKPYQAVTRSEFTVIAMRFGKLDNSGENIFDDVHESDWYYDAIVGSIKYGWITGYDDGNFHPNDNMTRACVTTIVNRMLGRSADEDFVKAHADDIVHFSDLENSHWAYYNIMEATNAHSYRPNDVLENWEALK